MLWQNGDDEEMMSAAQEVVFGDENADVYCNDQDGGHECDCQVEPDGHCHHGCPSILIVMGVI